MPIPKCKDDVTAMIAMMDETTDPTSDNSVSSHRMLAAVHVSAITSVNTANIMIRRLRVVSNTTMANKANVHNASVWPSWRIIVNASSISTGPPMTSMSRSNSVAARSATDRILAMSASV